MNADELKRRTKRFALDIIAFVQSLPPNQACLIIGKQLLRAGTSVGANYRAACRARSQADFVNKLGICEEEADESVYWLELLVESRNVTSEQIESLLKEANELTAIMSASRMTARAGLKR
ncbi:MAG: four helix bundle protein [Bacteroidetes bacterium]|jgi:four helix bundle protein|nr:four helix bundle protein [Bacteroidota bacterium]